MWYLDRPGLLPSPNIFRRVAQSTGANFDSGRIAVRIDSLKQIGVHPLFGSGPESYWLSGCCDRRILQAHNVVLQFLMEFGVIGCGIVALLVARAIKHLGGVAATMGLVAATSVNRVLACLFAAGLAQARLAARAAV